MEFGMRFARASALTATVAMATIVGTASADLRPPVADGSTAKAGKSAALAAPLPAVPTFVNGLAQPVFATAEADWVNYELWVQSTFDSDGDGKNDRIHVDVSRPKETDTDGLKVPVIFEDSPYYAGGANAANWSVEHELGQLPAGGRPARRGVLPAPPAARARGSAGSTRATSCRAATPSCTPSRPAPATPTAAPPPATRTRRTAPSPSSTGSTAAPRATRRATALDEIGPASAWHNGKTAMMGTSYNGTIPIAAATTGVEGLGRSSRSPRSPTGTTTTAPTASCARRTRRANGQNGNNGYLGEDLDVLTEYTYSRDPGHEPRAPSASR